MTQLPRTSQLPPAPKRGVLGAEIRPTRTSLCLQFPVVGNPVTGVRFHQEGARHGPLPRAGRVQSLQRDTDCSVWRRPRAARPAGARRVRLISIAHHLGQPAPSTAGRGREATPRTGARAGEPAAWSAVSAPRDSAGPRHGHAPTPRGLVIDLSWMKEQSSGLGDRGQPTWTSQVPILSSILYNPCPGEPEQPQSDCLGSPYGESGGTVSGIGGQSTNWVCLWLSSRAG